MSGHRLRFISAADVAKALPMREAIVTMRKAFTLVSSGRAIIPPRTVIEIPDRGGSLLFMPSLLSEEARFGVKIVSLFAGNPGRGLPRIQSLVVLSDGETGSPLAVIEGGSLTALRTGAASGSATQALAREDSSVAAIFGAGVQGRTQLEAVAAVRPIVRALVFDPSAEAREGFAREMSASLGIEVAAASSPAEALRDADIICTATISAMPVFDDRELKPGAHINAVGSYKPDRREIPSATVARSRVFVDQRDSAMVEAGDLLIARREGYVSASATWTELGELFSGSSPGRQDRDEITLFKSVGVGIQDLVAADVVLASAERLNIGTLVEL
jgi:ornithine cyclodeaminase/alanine dehydrogenase-like protein (mu-crystallin family)